jgi:uncharacterized protein YuzE
MKNSYDKEADALFVRFSDEVIIESEQVSPGVMFDFDQAGKIVGFEILNASKKLSGAVALTTLLQKTA